MSNSLSRAQAEIRAVLARSASVDDARHAEDTLAWLLRLKPDPGPALALAALGHDIDRAGKSGPARREDYESFEDFQDAHARRGARELGVLLEQCGVDPGTTARACWLVEHHECGGDPDANILHDADNLSWFRVSLPNVFRREGRAEAVQHCRFAYEGLSIEARHSFSALHHDDARLERLLRETEFAAGRFPSRWAHHG